MLEELDRRILARKRVLSRGHKRPTDEPVHQARPARRMLAVATTNKIGPGTWRLPDGTITHVDPNPPSP